MAVLEVRGGRVRCSPSPSGLDGGTKSLTSKSRRGAGLLFCLVVTLSSFALAQTPQARPAMESASTTAQAAEPQPSAEVEYTVGAGDVLNIRVWKEPELSRDNVVVRPDGMISMPLIGVVKVSGLPVSQIQQTLADKLRRFVNISQVTVTVEEIRSKFVYITGEVNRPGAYPLLSPIDLLHLVIRAGGLSPYAHRKSMYVLRKVNGKQQKIPVNYAKVLRGEEAQSLQLQEGDTVVVP
jgi:polysaccharide export outer membrane protein